MTATPYLYRPIPHYNGTVLKCAGMASDKSRAIVAEKSKDAGNGKTADGYLPGFIEVPHYLGDRIRADDHTLFTSVL